MKIASGKKSFRPDASKLRVVVYLGYAMVIFGTLFVIAFLSLPGDSKDNSVSFRSVESSLDGSTLTLEESEALLYSSGSLDNSNGNGNSDSSNAVENLYRSPFKTTAAIKFQAKVKTEKNVYVHDLTPFQRANGAMAAKFRSLYPRRVDMWYEDFQGGVEQGHLNLGQETTTNTYEGHIFFFTEHGNRHKEVARFTMTNDQVFYIVEDERFPAPKELRERTERELAFQSSYLNRTGIHWRHYFGPSGPRSPPTLFMWPAREIGHVHYVESTEGKWVCSGSAQECQSKETVGMELEVVSLRPRAFVIPNFLSIFEVDEIIREAAPSMALSQVGDVAAGAFASDTRTSQNSWLPRSKNAITETLFLRAADLLQVDEALLHRQAAAEDMQVVHYSRGQKYDSHHDWGVSGYPESRFITLLLYLTDMPSPNAGGETAFPKGNDGLGFKVQPGKGSAVLFYNLLEDGNGDDLALHAALPVNEGEKWLANFWVWDPKMKG